MAISRNCLLYPGWSVQLFVRSPNISLGEVSYYGLSIFVPATEISGDEDGNEVNISNREEPDTGKHNLQHC